MWIIRTLLMLVAFSAYTYAFYIKTDDVELQQESSDINLEYPEKYKNYSPEPRSLGIMETYEKIRNYLTSPWKETNSTNLTPENMQNGSHYENMQQNELSFDPYHLTRNISRSDPVDFHASEILPILSEKYLKINLTAGQKFEENFKNVKDDFVDDQRFQFKNDAINDIFSDVSESDKEIATIQEDVDEPTDLLRSLNSLNYVEDRVQEQDNPTSERNAEIIIDPSTDTNNIIKITTEEPNNDIAGDINHITTERTNKEVEYMIEDPEEQLLTTRAQVIGTTIIPSDETTYNTQLNVDFIQSNTKTEGNYMNGDQVENFNRQINPKPETSTILSGDDDDLIVIAGKPADTATYEKKFTETSISFDENDDSLIIQGRRLNSNEHTKQFPAEKTTFGITSIPITVTNLVLEEHTNNDLDKNIFTSTTSTFEESSDQIPDTTTQINQIKNINENSHKITKTVLGDTNDLVVLVTDPSNIRNHETTNAEIENDKSFITQGRGLINGELMTHFLDGRNASLDVNGADTLPEIKGSNLDENIFSITASPYEESSLKIVKYEKVFHDQTSENIIEENQIAETTTQIDQTENIKSDENDDDLVVIVDEPKIVKIEGTNSPMISSQIIEATTSQSDFTTRKVENDTKDSSDYFTSQEDTTLKAITDVDTTSNLNTKNKVQKEQLNEVSMITAPVYIDADLTLPILADAFNVLEISEELVKPRSTLNKSDTLEILGLAKQNIFENENIEVTTLNTLEIDNPAWVNNEYVNHHHQNEELPTEFVTNDQTINLDTIQKNPSTEFNKDIDFTTTKFLDHFEKTEDASHHDQVIYTTTLSDSTTIDNDHRNNYDHTTLSYEQDQIKSIPDGVNGRSFDISMNLEKVVPISISTIHHEEDRQLDLMTEETVNSNHYSQSFITDPPFNHIENDEPSKTVSELEAEDKTYLTATEVNFGSQKEDSSSMKINDQFPDLLSMVTTDLPKIEIVDKKYQNYEFSAVTTGLEHHEDISRTMKNSVFEENFTDGKIDSENVMTTVNQLDPITNMLFDNMKTTYKLELSTENSKLFEDTTKNSFEHATPVFVENQPISSPSEVVINELNETNPTDKSYSEVEGVHSGSTKEESTPGEYNDLFVELTTKFNIVENDDSKSNESNQQHEKSTNDESQQIDSVSNEESSNDISTQTRDLGPKSIIKENNSETSDSDESNETEEKTSKVESIQSGSSEENSASIEISDETIDNKSDVSTQSGESKQSEETPSKEESVQSASIEDDSSSTDVSDETTNNKSQSENSESNDSNVSNEKSAESKTLNVEKKTDSTSNEEDSSSVEVDDDGIAPEVVTKNNFSNEANDSNHSGERSSEEFHHMDKNIQSTPTDEDISSLESSEQSDDHDNIKFKKPDQSSEEDSSNESVEEIIPYPIQRVPQGRSFSFDNENNNGQQIKSDEKLPPFVLSDPDLVENVDQSVVVNEVDNSDSKNSRDIEGDSLDSDDVSTAVVETLIEAAELTTEFTRHISSFRTPSEASNTIFDTTYETPTTSFPPDMDESDRNKLHALANTVATTVGTSKLTVLSFALIGLAIFAIVATISVALIFKFHKRRETFDIQLEERHEKKDSNTTQSTTNGVE